MKIVKWMLVLVALVSNVRTQYQNVTNTCSNLGYYAPDNSGKCTVSSSGNSMCCFVSVKNANTTTNFCALVTGSYFNPQSVVDLQNDIGNSYTVLVICNSTFLKFSLVILLVASLIIF